MSKYGYYVSLGTPKVKQPHFCKTPSRLDRWFMGARLGAIWHCTQCGQEWAYKSTTGAALDYSASPRTDGWVKGESLIYRTKDF
jgi:ribosomal protein L37AE/L43A